MATHKLKILPVYFVAVLRGDKTFEIRDNSDRGFQKGDRMILRELHKEAPPEAKILPDKIYTGRMISAEITYVTNFKQLRDYVVLGFKVLKKEL